MIRVADYVIERLYDEGAKHVFMVTGRGLLFLSDAVARHKKIVNISVHHEQAGAFAAMAYAQANEKIGVCLVSTGCASTNAITGLLCAWQDQIPCVFISGQNKLSQTVRHTGVPIRTYGQQEMDIISVVESLTNYSTMITDPNDIRFEIEKALFMAQTGKKGPVWIDIPLDIQNMRIAPDDLKLFTEQKEQRSPSNNDIEFVLESLKSAKRPVILIGSGIRASGGLVSFEDFIKRNPFPVTFSHSAVDSYGANNELSIGAVGSLGGTRAANFTIQNADLLIV